MPLDVETWINFGVLGLLVAAFMTGTIVPGHAYKEKVADCGKMLEELKIAREELKAVLLKYELQNYRSLEFNDKVITLLTELRK